jgi:hypothetical protein
VNDYGASEMPTPTLPSRELGRTRQRVESCSTAGVALARARLVLIDTPGVVFGDTRQGAPRRADFRSNLRVGLGAGASVHQQVAVRIGAPEATDGGLAIPVRWEPTGWPVLLPAFEGELEATGARRGTSLCLRGIYTIPLGIAGRVAHRLVGRRVVQRSLRGFVKGLAHRLTSEVERRLADLPPRA